MQIITPRVYYDRSLFPQAQATEFLQLLRLLSYQVVEGPDDTFAAQCPACNDPPVRDAAMTLDCERFEGNGVWMYCSACGAMTDNVMDALRIAAVVAEAKGRIPLQKLARRRAHRRGGR